MVGRWLAYLACLLVASVPPCFCLEDPLPSWNEGKAKQAILQFVQKTTSPDGEEYIPPEERIAAFDQDGTLWVEKPLYTQLVFAIDAIRKLSREHPEWKDQEPYRSLLEDNAEKIQQFSLQDIEKILSVSHAGMSVAEYQKNVREWLQTAQHPRFHRRYTDLAYQPMLELIHYLKNHGYKTYIVSGGGQDFIRTYSEEVYGIPTEQIIGTAAKTRYHYRNTYPELIKLPQVLFIDDKAGKPEAIHLFIGKRPAAAFGNSDGDRQMLEWSQEKGDSLQLLVHHDDAEREYAYDAHSKIGTFSEALKEEAKKRRWIIVSMKNDWKTIFKF